MKVTKLFAYFLFVLTIIISSSFCQLQEAKAYPAINTCDTSGCHLTVRNNEDSVSEAGSLRNAIQTACSTNGDDLISFAQYSIDTPDTPVIILSMAGPIVVPLRCNGKIEIAGRSDAIEVVFDASRTNPTSGVSYFPRSSTPVLEPSVSGRNDLCAIYINSNNNSLHHFTIKGAPFGVCVYGNGNQVSDNNIGVMRNGAAAANQVGVYVSGSNNLVLKNNIASNTSHGIVLKGSQNTLQQNNLGVSPADLSIARGNAGSAIRLITGAALNLIGGDSVLNGNMIRHNGAGGVVLENGAGTGNKISHNRFAKNTGLAIDLKANGVSLPTAGETGPNNMISMPTDVQVVPMRTEAPWDTYIFRGRAPANFFIEVYLVDDADGTDILQQLAGQSYGEGDYLLTSQRVVPARDGKFSILISSSLLDLHKKVSAIIRDGAGNTSEFSAALELKNIPNPQYPNCGNSRIDEGETCDDGGIVGGDGCSSICSVETGFVCEGTPSVCHPEVSLCGNGELDTGEACDDANRSADDGCAGDCTVEPGWGCTRVLGERSICTRHNPEDACGNGHVDAGEECDDSSNSCCDMSNCHFASSATSCDDHNASTTPDHCDGHGVCTGTPTANPLGNPSTLTADATGPTRIRVTFTDNSEGETGFALERADGACSATSTFVHQATLPPAAGTGSVITYNDDSVQPGRTYCYRVRAINPTGHSEYSNTDDATTPTVSTLCGNGHPDTGEACDDSNTANGDGCSNSCQVETGYTCSGTPSVCRRTDQNAPPSGLTATATGPTQVRVTFIDNTNNETGFGIDRADGECRPDSVFTQIGIAPSLEGVGGTVVVIDNTVQPGQTYCYRARALTPTGSTSPSNAASATTPNPAITPNPPGTIGDGLEGGACSLHQMDRATSITHVWVALTFFMGTFLMLGIRKKKSY